ncbi:MAG: hypothetical protein OXL97_11020 [Chloroflexota bacterium]|nr:hypothetical protein [Chloroflexota bacterium]MDE2884968.1 hypothetical protein [Chloroflexota bacterium]
MQLRNVDRGLTYADIAFIREALGTDAPAEDEMPLLLAEEERRAELLGSQRLFDALLPHDGSLAPVSPRLYFEALLRRAVDELRGAQHTFERTGSRSGERVPVFDAADVAAFAAQPRILHYLAGMLASFTKVHSHTERVWVRRGVVRKVRYSDLDVHSMLRLIQQTEEHERLPLYRRTGDLCLLILGIFPDFAATAHRYPGTGALRAQSSYRRRLSTEEYETVAAQMYAHAARYDTGEMSTVHRTLEARIPDAKKPLSFISEHYLGFRRDRLFGMGE